MNNSLVSPMENGEDKPYLNVVQIVSIDIIFLIVISTTIYRQGYSWYIILLVGSFGAAATTLFYCAAIVWLFDAMSKPNLWYGAALKKIFD